jgi:hypothetical protein
MVRLLGQFANLHSSRFFQWVYLAVPNAMDVQRGYVIFYLIPSLFEYASDATLVWTFSRTVCQPLVVANDYHRAKGVGLGFAISYGLLASAAWIYLGIYTGFQVNGDWSDIVYFLDGDLEPDSGFTTMIVECLGVLWGLAFFCFTVHALRKTKATLDPAYRAVPKIMTAASVLWIVRAGMITVTEVGTWDLVVRASRVYSFTPLMKAIFVDLFGLAIFGLLFLCYRSNLAQLYSGRHGYSKSDNDEYRYVPEGAASATNSVELQNAKAHNVEPGIEVRGASNV